MAAVWLKCELLPGRKWIGLIGGRGRLARRCDLGKRSYFIYLLLSILSSARLAPFNSEAFRYAI